MKSSYSELWVRATCAARRFAVFTLMVALTVISLSAAAYAAPAADNSNDANAKVYHTIYLKGIVNQDNATDILVDLRNMVPSARYFYVQSRNAISIMGTEHDYEIAKQVVTDMTQGHRVFRLTYILTNLGNGKAAGHRTFAFVVASGERVSLKKGGRVPVVTGYDGKDASHANKQVQYLDVGLNLNASLNGPADDLVLETKVVQSALAPNKSENSSIDPVIHQTMLNSTTILPVGKPVVLGSLDIPGTTKHEQIEVTAEPVELAERSRFDVAEAEKSSR